jgi:hypothetical protein
MAFSLFSKKNLYPEFAELDFNTACGGEYWVRKKVTKKKDREIYQELLNLYKSYQRSLEPLHTIPKIFHQIWLGTKPIPERYQTFIAKLKQLHPTWDYRLWQDSDLESFEFKNRDLFDLSTNVAEKADILRYAILEHFGGVYLDLDVEFFKPIDQLAEHVDFFAGLEPFHYTTGIVTALYIANTIIGSRPNHPILQGTNEFLRDAFVRFHKVEELEHVTETILKTYLPFNKAILRNLRSFDYKNIVLPTAYLYTLCPVGWRPLKKFRRSIFKKNLFFDKVYPQTYAVHYWDNNWFPPKDPVSKCKKWLS